jgi:flagellin
VAGSGTIAGLAGGRDAGSTTIQVVADTVGTAANGVTVTLIEDATITNNTAVAAFNGANIEVRVRGTVAYSAIATQINGLAGYSATTTAAAGDQNYFDTSDTPPAATTLGGGVAGSGGLTQDAVIQLSGVSGSEVFSFGAGTSISDVAAGINAQSDATGVTATVSSTTLQLKSSGYGLTEFVDISVVSEAVGGTFTAGLGGVTAGRDAGTDVVASVNGISANGKGNLLSINTATLDLSTTVAAGFTGTSSFTITGGGALFQLGPDVVSNQQARIGIGSVNTAQLGGVNGLLYQLASGGSADLATDLNTAASIVEEAIDQVTTLRGRLGAFQRTLLETNKQALGDTLVNLTDAESQIRDADFASETAALTRSQILVQSGTTVLQIANSNPQNVLALLRG